MIQIRSRSFQRNSSAYRIFFILAAASIFRSRSKARLKLKEITYIHAEGYPAGEMKHGPNALIDEKLPVVFVNTREEGNAAHRAALREDALEYS